MCKILVIDDRWDERGRTYTNVLSQDFEIISVEHGSDLYRYIDNIDVDAYLIDIVLDRWVYGNKPLTISKVLERIKNNKPKILVSNEYTSLVEEGELTLLLSTIIDNGYNVNSFLLWDEFQRAVQDKTTNKDNTETIISKIKLEILRHKKTQIIKSDKQFNFAVFCALGEELDPFLKKFISNENIIFEKDVIENIHFSKSVLVTKSNKKLRFIAVQQEEMGNTDAAIIISKILSEFCISYVFMIGVCGGRDGKVKIGDIVIPHEIVAYQHGKITESGFNVNVGFVKSQGNIKSAVENYSNNILNDIWLKYMTDLNKNTGSSLPVQRPVINFNEMASGAMVIDKDKELDSISVQVGKPKLCAIDMESYAVYRACEILNVKASVIKSVMDLSSNKSDEYKAYAAYLSANYLYSILYEEILIL